jgi:hypothetical protein
MLERVSLSSVEKRRYKSFIKDKITTSIFENGFIYKVFKI